jgi:hypothetical protein
MPGNDLPRDQTHNPLKQIQYLTQKHAGQQTLKKKKYCGGKLKLLYAKFIQGSSFV